MSKLTKLLASTGLVTLDAEDRASDAAPIDNSQDQDQVLQAAQAPPALAVPKDFVIAEGKAFDEVYGAANLPAAAFTAEKLLKVLDGLTTQPLEVRKQMVHAMAAADDAWKLEDVVLDAGRKIKVLQGAKQTVASQVSAAATNAQNESSRIASERELAEENIRKQIAELTALLERTSAKATQQAADAAAASKATQEAGIRETARLDAEIVRLGQISTYFSPSPATKL